MVLQEDVLLNVENKVGNVTIPCCYVIFTKFSSIFVLTCKSKQTTSEWLPVSPMKSSPDAVSLVNFSFTKLDLVSLMDCRKLPKPEIETGFSFAKSITP